MEFRSTILQFDKTSGAFITAHNGYNNASATTGIPVKSIRKVTSGERGSVNGFVFKSVDNRFFDYSVYLQLQCDILEQVPEITDLDINLFTDYKLAIDTAKSSYASDLTLAKIDYLFTMTHTKASKNFDSEPASLIELPHKIKPVPAVTFNRKKESITAALHSADLLQTALESDPSLQEKFEMESKRYKRLKEELDYYVITDKEEI